MYVLRYLLLSFFVGLIVLISVMQNDTWTHRMLENHIKKTFKENFEAEFTGTISHFSFFAPRIEFFNIRVVPYRHNEWSWSAKKMTSTFSWFHFFTTGVLDVALRVDEWNVDSALIENTPAITSHLRALFENPTFPVPVELVSVSMNKANIRFFHEGYDSTCAICFNSRSYLHNGVLKNTVYFLSGGIAIHGIDFLDQLSGTIQFQIDHIKDTNITSKVTGSFVIPGLDNEHCYVHGSWSNNYGRFSLTSSHDTCSIDPVIIGKTKGRIISTFPVQLIKLLVPHIFQDTVVGGTCGVSLVFDRVGSNGLHGQVVVHDVTYNGQQWCDTVKITMRALNNLCSGAVDIRSTYGECGGTYTCAMQEKKAYIQMENTSALLFPFTRWYVDPRDAHIECQIDENTAHITTSCTTQHAVSNQSHVCTLDTKYKSDAIALQGSFDDTTFEYVNGITTDDKSISRQKHTFIWKDKEGGPLATCNMIHAKKEVDAQVKGQLHMSAVQRLARSWLGYTLQAKGKLSFAGIFDGNRASMHAELQEGTIRLPKTYNCIDGLSTDVVLDIKNRECRLFDTECRLHTGAIRLKEGRFCFDEEWNNTFVHVPLLIDQCLINIEKDLFASVSGAVALEKESLCEQLCLRGTVLLDRAQVKKDILSTRAFSSLQSQKTAEPLQNYEMLCDIALKTIRPITISTPQITTDVSVDLQLSNQLFQPDISGAVLLSGGKLEFPYKPLYITRGTVLFTPEHSYDPVIELIAKNTIKNHDVALHVAGLASAHNVMVHATPNLTDEQVVALLLFGSPHESLNVLMPALITQNLEGVLLGAQNTSIINSYVKKVFKFVSKHFVPRFTDQTGRGGIRGALDIDINDRLHVLLQKNFSLSEDTRFEVEYQVSDDIALRAIRDERRDIGGEVEMRWKF